MALAAGTRLGVFEVRSALGVGGMGEVYRAFDTSLGRDVALKILPEAFAEHPRRLSRFEREARLLASLEHPHIATVHGFVSDGPVRALVMELVDGPTLEERMAGGPLPLADTLAIARQIAEALQAAHEKHIVHRDLKPANIKLRSDGTVKVLDFGLAKALAANTDDDVADTPHRTPTLTAPGATQAGAILGTAAYMSPEQARGDPVDQRTDLWAFGVVLYEMLTARALFARPAFEETRTAVLTSEPDWTVLPHTTPAAVRRLLRRCLEKDRRKRLDSAGVVLLEIDEALETPQGDRAAATHEGRRPRLDRLAWPLALTALLAALVALGPALRHLRESPPQASPVVRFASPLPEGQVLGALTRHNIAVSPDGLHMVYVANDQLYLRRLDDTTSRPIPGTKERVLSTPFFSPDGRWVGFIANGVIKKVTLDGHSAVTIGEGINDDDDLAGASWGPGDEILISQHNRIVRVPASGGPLQTVIRMEMPEGAYGPPQLLPDGDHVLFTIARASGTDRFDRAQIVAQSLASGERRVLIDGGSDARYVKTGHLVYVRKSALLAARFDAETLAVRGGPVVVAPQVSRAFFMRGSAAFFAVSDTGELAYFTGADTPGNRVLLADTKGTLTSLSLPPGGYYIEPRFSPDGGRVAVEIFDEDGENVWILDTRGQAAPRRLTFGEENGSPEWSPDGTQLAYVSNREGGLPAIYRQRADGAGQVERLTDVSAVRPMNNTMALSPDGRFLLFTENGRDFADIWILPLQPLGPARPLIVGPDEQARPAVSPDGKWVAYDSTESGRREIYVQPFPPTGAKYQISSGGRVQAPLWSRDGAQVFYAAYDDPPGLIAARIDTRNGFAVTSRARVLTVPVGSSRAYDVLPDGRRFVVATSISSPDIHPQLHVVLNWPTEVERLSAK